MPHELFPSYTWVTGQLGPFWPENPGVEKPHGVTWVIFGLSLDVYWELYILGHLLFGQTHIIFPFLFYRTAITQIDLFPFQSQVIVDVTFAKLLFTFPSSIISDVILKVTIKISHHEVTHLPSTVNSWHITGKNTQWKQTKSISVHLFALKPRWSGGVFKMGTMIKEKKKRRKKIIK